VSANGSLHQQPSTQLSGEGSSLLLALGHVDTSLNQMANTCMQMNPSVFSDCHHPACCGDGGGVQRLTDTKTGACTRQCEWVIQVHRVISFHAFGDSRDYAVKSCYVVRVSALSAVDCDVVDHNGLYG